MIIKEEKMSDSIIAYNIGIKICVQTSSTSTSSRKLIHPITADKYSAFLIPNCQSKADMWKEYYQGLQIVRPSTFLTAKVAVQQGLMKYVCLFVCLFVCVSPLLKFIC